MNILYHHRTRGEDVEGVHIRGIVDALRALGHRVDLVSPPGVDPEKNAASQHKSAPRRRASPLSLLSRYAPEAVFEAAELGYNAYALPALESRLLRRRYDLLYERYALFSVAGVLTAGRRRLPLILEVNDSAAVGSRIRPLHLQAAARRVERFVWNRADAVVTISHYFRDLILEAGVTPDRVHVIPNAVDEAAFSTLDCGEVRARLGLDGKIAVGYVGALNFWRRVDMLVNAFARLAARHPAAHLVLIGEGPDREGVAELARRLGVDARVHFVGKVPHAAIPSHLAALDVVVIPHSSIYGSPMKLFEYMAAGRAVVAPWLPPIVSVIGADDGGVLFPPLDEDGLTRALDGLCADGERRARLGARAREKALSEYVWRHHAQTILAIRERLSR